MSRPTISTPTCSPRSRTCSTRSPGTLLVVSHDRYLIERVTDQQYAVLDGKFRHLPKGVEQYLELRSKSLAAGLEPAGQAAPRPRTQQPEGRRAAQRREGVRGGRSQDREAAGPDRASVHLKLAEHDQSDYAGLGALSTELDGLQSQLSDVELRWLELSELLELRL